SFQFGNEIAVWVDEARLENVDELFVRDVETSRKLFRVRQRGDNVGVGSAVRQSVNSPERIRGRVSQNFMLVARETQLLHQDVAPAVRVGSTLQLVVNTKTFHRERKRHFKLVEVPAQVFKRLMKRQRYRESFVAQSRVRRVHHELRTREQILRRRCT